MFERFANTHVEKFFVKSGAIIAFSYNFYGYHWIKLKWMNELHWWLSVLPAQTTPGSNGSIHIVCMLVSIEMNQTVTLFYQSMAWWLSMCKDQPQMTFVN